MRGLRSWSIWVPLLIWVLAWPSIAQAAARVVPPPGWHESSGAAPDAQRRAGRWKDALGLRLTQVVSAPDDDRFAETVAVFERTNVVSVDVMDDDARAIAELSSTVANVVGSGTPDDAAQRTTAAGHRVIWARWFVDEFAYECVLAPSGGHSTVIVIAVRASELDDYRELIDTMISELVDVSDPMPHFSLLYWRLGAVLVWLALALALHAAMLRLVELDDDHATAGRRAALINLGLVVLGSIGAHAVLAQRELAIVTAGSSVAGMTEWVLVAGLLVVGAHFLISTRMDRGVVQSAPSSGAFASGVYSTAEVLRVSRSGVRPIPRELLESSTGQPAPEAAPSRITIDKDELE